MNSEHLGKPQIGTFELWLITISVMLVAVIEVLDMTIVNVALPSMMGALGANADQITWVLTSYIVASAICMPLTGFLVTRFGRKKILLIDIVGFTLASMACGMAGNLMQIVIFRILQGLFGATLVPLSQYILRDSFPNEQQGKAMAIWGVGIMAGPVFGPTLGGYITETMNWRWIFYINIPVCIIAFIMASQVIKETATQKQKIDWLGLILMTLGVGALQLFLDQGNQYNWLESNLIIALIATFIVSTGLFILRGINKPDNIINLSLFRDRNFTAATLVTLLCSICIFGVIAIQPMMLENLMGYPANAAGKIMAPRGIACAISMMMIAQLIGKVDPRKLIIFGLLLCAAGSYISIGFDLVTSKKLLILSGIIHGFGMGFFFVPVSAIALSTLPPKDTAEGSGLFSFGRSIGMSIGISILGTVLTRQTQVNWNRLGGHIQDSSLGLQMWLSQHGMNFSDPMTAKILAMQVAQQANMIAFINCYWLTVIGYLLLIPLVFILEKPDLSQGEIAMEH